MENKIVSHLDQLEEQQTVSSLLDMLSDEDDKVCDSAEKALKQLAQEDAEPILSGLYHDNKKVRQYVRYILWSLLNPFEAKTIDFCIAALSHPHPNVRFWAVNHLTHKATERAARVLMDMAHKETDPAIQAAISNTLANYCDEWGSG